MGTSTSGPATAATTTAPTPSAHDRVNWRRAEFVLTLLAFVGFLTLPIRITTIYDGLPAHPLFVHVPVVLIPVTIVTAVVFAVRTDWLKRYGIALSVVSIVAMSSIFLTMQAGAALRAALNLQGPAAQLISEHSHAAHILAYLYVLFTATLILTFAARRIGGGMPTGVGLIDRPLSSKSNVRCAARRARAARNRRGLHGVQNGRPRRKSRVGGTNPGRPPWRARWFRPTSPSRRRTSACRRPAVRPGQSLTVQPGRSLTVNDPGRSSTVNARRRVGSVWRCAGVVYAPRRTAETFRRT